MKNFTKQNFKTNPLWIRLLIMTFMLLIGTGSVWAQDMYVAGSMTNWAANQVKLSTSSSTYSGYYYATFTVEAGTYEYKIKESGNKWWCSTYNTTNSSGVTYTTRNDNCSNIQIKVPSAGTLEIYHNKSNDNTFAIFYVPCTKSISEESGTYENGEITISAEFNTCGNAYIGFQWKEENDSWCYDNNADCYVMLGEQEKSNETVTTTLTKSGGTYVFRPYIVDGSDATKWIYGDEFEVITCSDPSAGYSISNENASVDWDGTEKEVIITTVNGYATPSKIYYEGSETKPTAVGEYTITIDVPSNGTYCAATDLEIGTFTITCPTIAAPAITESATVCAGTPVTLSNYNGVNDNTVKWYSDEECNSEVTEQVTLTDNGTKYNANYYAKAYDEASGCYSSEYSTLTFTVNPLPTINISGSEEAVLYEDVELTAATDGTSISWEITEGDGSLSSTIGNFVTLTSSSTGNVTVTATATLGSCTATDTHEVEFSEEDCTPVPSYYDIQITFNHPSPNTTDSKGQWWGMGTLYYSTNNSTWSSIDMGSETSGTHTERISNISKSTLYVYFQSYWTYSHGSKAKSNTLTLERGKKYDIKITRHGDNNINATATATETGSITNDPPIKAPAVKMVSAEYDEVNDKIVAKGAVYKTGCGTTFWGFQYSTDGQKWGTAETDYIRPNPGNSLTKAGEFEYSFAIPNAGGGDIYYIRAYALNNYNGSYALSNAVYSATSLPVEIPSKTIESATIALVEPSTDTEVCPQSTVYLKVSYVGGDFTDFVAEEDFPGTDLELVNHDKANNYAIFSFTATAAGTANITISNKSGSTVTPADGVSITLKDVQVVTPPIITINPESAMICQGDDATISIVEENQNYTYTIYKDGEALNPQSFTITEAGIYTVGATENECNTSATSMPIELKVVSSDVKIGLEADNTAIGPWQPLKLTVTPAKGYEYTLEGLDGMVYTKEGDVYTIKIPRPNDWSFGNSGTQQDLEKEDKVFTAKIKVSDEVSCGSKEVTVTLTDTEENCE